MGYIKKTWKNRSSEFPTRRTLTPVAGEDNTYDVTRAEGAIAEEGDAFSAENMNDFEERVAKGIEDANDGRACISTYDRWLRFDPNNRKGLIIKKGTKIKIGEDEYYAFTEDTPIDLSTYITTNGAEYKVYIDENGEISASTEELTSKIKIGRFHTLCVNVGSNVTMVAPAKPSSGLRAGDKYLVKSYKANEDEDFYNFYNKNITAVAVKSYYDLVTCQHPLSGFVAGDILPESVFCLSFHPECLYEDGVVYDKDTDIAVDIYLQSGCGHDTRSVYNATHMVNRQPINHQEDMRMVGKRLLKDFEFSSIALGSNEKTNIVGSSDKTQVGGHSDTAGRRMISAIGCEECCGYLSQWLDEIGVNGGSGWNTYDGNADFGQHYGTVPYVLSAGGNWHHGSSCGSRCRTSDSSRSHVSSGYGARGSSRVARGA